MQPVYPNLLKKHKSSLEISCINLFNQQQQKIMKPLGYEPEIA